MAHNDDIDSDWSEVRSFDVLNPGPELISPENESVIAGNSVYLEWNDLEDASYFHVQVSQDSDFSELIEEFESVEDIYVGLDDLNPGAHYYWRVRAFNHENINTAWSETYVFATDIPLGGTNGNDFWVSYMQNFDNSGVVLRLFISSLYNSTVLIENEITGWSEEINVAANGTEIVEVPLPSGLATESEVIGNKGIHITSNNLISVFAGNYKQYTTDATVVLPTEFLGTEYIAVCYTGINQSTTPSEFMVVSTEDNTNITIVPSVTTDSTLAGDTINVQLNKGETYLIKGAGIGDLTGSQIYSDKNIAVFSGHSCAYVPSGYAACDHLYEQMYPVSTFGNDFIAIPLFSRVGSTIRVLASEDNSTIDIGNEQIVLDKYEFYEKTIYETVSISSDKPISVAQYSNGQQWDIVESDPFFIVLSPSEMFINNVDFYSINTGAIERHFVNILSGADCYFEIELDGVNIGDEFEPVSSNNEYYYAQIEVEDGIHNISSSSANNCGFIASMYGFGPWDSYGFNAGISNGDIYISDIEIELTEETENLMEISHDIGTEFEISCTIEETEEPFVESVYLHYRNYEDEEGVYQTVSMVFEDNSWTGIIPSEESLYPGVQFYITADDGVLTYSKPEVQAEERPFNISVLVNYLPEVELLTYIQLVDSLLDTDIPVYASAKDQTDSLEEVRLFYRKKGSQQYTSTIMELEDGSDTLFLASIPAEFVTRSGFDYFVEAKDNLGLRKSTEVISCLLIGLPAPEQLYPPNDTAHINTDITFKWENVDDAESYMIQISTDSTFSSIIYENNNILRDSININILEYSQTYYWRIRARFEFQYSDWSEIWRFTTRDEPLPAPELTSPVDMAEEVSQSPLLQWQTVLNATSYEILIAEDDTFETVVYEYNSTSASKRASSLDSLSEYYWRVRAMKGVEPGIWSDVWSFTTAAQQDKFVNLTMAYNGYFQNSEHIKMSVLIELRTGDELMESTVVHQEAALLNTDGEASVNLYDIEDGDYWFVVRAPGYMPVAIPEMQTLSAEGISWDFTTSSSQSVAGTSVLIYNNSLWQIRPGDLDASRSIAAFDVNYLIPNLGNSAANQIPDIISNDAEYSTDASGKLVSIDILYNGYYNSGNHKNMSVTIDLMLGDILTESELVSSKPGIIDSDGNLEIDFGDIEDGDYWVIVRASGYMPVAIPEKQSLSSDGIVWDFSTSSDQSVAGTSVMIYSNGEWQVRPGDFDASRSIAAFDVNYLIPNLGNSASNQIPE
jgi:hypothetical protein